MLVSINRTQPRQVNEPKVVHCKKEENHIYIGRPSIFGNPYGTKEDSHARFIVSTREEAIEKDKQVLFEQLKNPNNAGILFEDIIKLKGYNLGCWCSPKECHGDILLKIANCQHEFTIINSKHKKCNHCEIIIPIE